MGEGEAVVVGVEVVQQWAGISWEGMEVVVVSVYKRLSPVHLRWVVEEKAGVVGVVLELHAVVRMNAPEAAELERSAESLSEPYSYQENPCFLADLGAEEVGTAGL